MGLFLNEHTHFLGRGSPGQGTLIGFSPSTPLFSEDLRYARELTEPPPKTLRPFRRVLSVPLPDFELTLSPIPLIAGGAVASEFSIGSATGAVAELVFSPGNITGILRSGTETVATG